MVTNQVEWIENLKEKVLLAKSEINEDQWPEFVEWLIKETNYDITCEDCQIERELGYDSGIEDADKEWRNRIDDMLREVF